MAVLPAKLPFRLGPEKEEEPKAVVGSPAGNPFTYLARDLLTWEPLDPLPYKEVQFGKTLDTAGTWKGSLPLADERVQRFAWKEATAPSLTALFVDLEGTLIWGGIIWPTGYESDKPGNSMDVTANEFGSYWAKRLQAEDYGTLWEAGEDPMRIAQRVIEDAQAAEREAAGYLTGSKIPIILNPAGGSTASVAVSYPGSSLQTIDSILSTLTQMGYGVGFDISHDVAYLPGTTTPGVTINLWWPLKGRTAQETGIVILARDTIKWTYPEDGTVQGWEITETGSGSTEPETGVSEAAKERGYPLLQKVVPRTQVTAQGLLAECLIGDLALYEYPAVTPSIVLPCSLPGTPQRERATLALGEFDVGDRFEFRVDPVATSAAGTPDYAGSMNADPRFPEGATMELRINGYTVQPKDSGLATVQLDCGPPGLLYTYSPPPPH
jgi:hypothetical protein